MPVRASENQISLRAEEPIYRGEKCNPYLANEVPLSSLNGAYASAAWMLPTSRSGRARMLHDRQNPPLGMNNRPYPPLPDVQRAD
jgi:hypothetical protein